MTRRTLRNSARQGKPESALETSFTGAGTRMKRQRDGVSRYRQFL